MRFFILILLVLLSVARANANQLDDGRLAYRSGDPLAALKLWQPLADQGDVEAQIAIGGLYKFGAHGIKPDNSEANKWFQKAINNLQPLADQGNPKAQFQIGRMYFHEWVPHEKIEARDAWSEKVRSIKESFKWFKKSADQGYAPAEVAVGAMYRVTTGDVVSTEALALEKHDDVEAMKWFRKAADQGNSSAEFQIGLLYDFGHEGIPKDKSEAVKWWQRAAEHGMPIAQYDLGEYYKNLSKYDDAAKWYLRAANQGDLQAQRAIGDMYLEGQGVDQNYVEAYKWFSLTPVGKIGRMHAESKMTPDQITQAQRLAAEWRPKLEHESAEESAN